MVQLGVNAGQFKTGMEQSADARQWASEQNQANSQQQAHALQAQQMQLEAGYHHDQINAMNNWHQGELGNQQASINQRATAAGATNDYRNAKLGADGQYHDQLIGVRQDANGIRQDSNDLRRDHNTAQEGHWDNQDQLGNDKLDSDNQYRDRLATVAEGRLKAINDRMANQLAGGNPNSAAVMRQQIEQRVASDHDLTHVANYQRTLMTEEEHLKKVLDPSNPMRPSQDEKDQAAARLKANRAEQVSTLGQYQNMMHRKLQPAIAATTQPLGSSPPPLSPGLGGPMPTYSPGPDATPAPAPMPQATAPIPQQQQPLQMQPYPGTPAPPPVSPMTATNPATGQKIRFDPTSNTWVPA